jgi:hypothetical protein
MASAFLGTQTSSSDALAVASFALPVPPPTKKD